jgi:hypothetical protein
LFGWSENGVFFTQLNRIICIGNLPFVGPNQFPPGVKEDLWAKLNRFANANAQEPRKVLKKCGMLFVTYATIDEATRANAFFNDPQHRIAYGEENQQPFVDYAVDEFGPGRGVKIVTASASASAPVASTVKSSGKQQRHVDGMSNVARQAVASAQAAMASVAQSSSAWLYPPPPGLFSAPGLSAAGPWGASYCPMPSMPLLLPYLQPPPPPPQPLPHLLEQFEQHQQQQQGQWAAFATTASAAPTTTSAAAAAAATSSTTSSTHNMFKGRLWGHCQMAGCICDQYNCNNNGQALCGFCEHATMRHVDLGLAAR